MKSCIPWRLIIQGGGEPDLGWERYDCTARHCTWHDDDTTRIKMGEKEQAVVSRILLVHIVVAIQMKMSNNMHQDGVLMSFQQHHERVMTWHEKSILSYPIPSHPIPSHFVMWCLMWPLFVNVVLVDMFDDTIIWYDMWEMRWPDTTHGYMDTWYTHMHIQTLRTLQMIMLSPSYMLNMHMARVHLDFTNHDHDMTWHGMAASPLIHSLTHLFRQILS